MGSRGAGITAARMRSLTLVRYPTFFGLKNRMRLLVATFLTLVLAAPAAAQDYATTKPRRQFVTVSIDWMNTEPLHFASHPLEDLVGRRIASAQNETYE